MSPVRPAVFAGRFYPSDPLDCAAFLDQNRRTAEHAGIAALIPHAGWIYSGPTAALSIASIASYRPATVVIFGAVHVLNPNDATIYAEGAWSTPLGDLRVDEELGRRLRRRRFITDDPRVHAREHSIEVELPLVRHYLGDVMILPIMVRPGPHAAEIGRTVAREAADLGRRLAFLGSTDLTHYGPAFGFEPAGPGEKGIRWAKEVNDRRFLDAVGTLDAEALVPEAMMRQNACGSGAVAAMIAAALEAGGREYRELEHTSSAEVEVRQGGRPENSVGYHSGVVLAEAGRSGE